MVKGFHILAAWLLLNAAAFGQAFTFHDTAFVGLIAQPGVTPTNYAAFYFTTTGAATGTIAELTVTSAMDVDWGDGTTNSYTGSGARTHNYAGAGTWQVRLMTPALVTALTLSDNKITLNSSEIAQCTNMVTFQATGLKAGTFNSTDVSAWRPTVFYLFSMPAGYAGTFDSTDVSAWRPTLFYLFSMPAGYAGTFNSTDVSAWRPTYFRLYSMPAGYAGTFNSTDVSAWRPTLFYLFSMPAGYAGTFNSTDVSAWRPTDFRLFSMPAGYAGTFDSTDVSAWRPTTLLLYSMPAGYAGTFNSTDVSAWRPTVFYLYSMPAGYAGTFDSTDVSAWRPTDFRLYAMPAGYAGTFNSTDVSAWRPTYFRWHSMPAGYAVTITSGGFAGWTNTIDLNLSGNSLSQASVDQVLADCYTAFATRTATGGTITLDGNNITPSGTLQAQCPPTTGKEFAYELVNDSCGTNTTKKWTTVTLSTNLPTAVTFSDDFNRADAANLGANWTVLAGGWSNHLNQAVQSTYDSQYAKNAIGYVTNTATVSQYAKVTIDGSAAAGNGMYPQILLRINGTNECYGIEWKPNEDAIAWYYYTNAVGNATQIASASTTIATNDTLGVTITGTGTGTIVRAWVNPTGLPSAADNWDGDTTPTVSFTDDPAIAADTGLGVGLALYVQLNLYCKFDDFFGGDIP